MILRVGLLSKAKIVADEAIYSLTNPAVAADVRGPTLLSINKGTITEPEPRPSYII